MAFRIAAGSLVIAVVAGRYGPSARVTMAIVAA